MFSQPEFAILMMKLSSGMLNLHELYMMMFGQRRWVKCSTDFGDCEKGIQ
jgi:hypothetical protein